MALLVAVTCTTLALGVLATTASAQTADEKSDFFYGCIGSQTLTKTTAQFFIDCCKAAGGSVQIDYDADGNPTAFSCTLHSDPSETTQGPGLSNAALPYRVSPTGALMSGDASGGQSRAGVYGLFQIVVTPTEIIP
jgi:hypothetical protein